MEYNQGPLAFLKELLLLSGVFKSLVSRILELCTIYRIIQVYTSKQVKKGNSTPNNVNRIKQCYKATVHVARIA
jgi:hypothetical protein